MNPAPNGKLVPQGRPVLAIVAGAGFRRTVSVGALALLLGACAGLQRAGDRPPPGAAGAEQTIAESQGWGWAVPLRQAPVTESAISGAHPSLRMTAGTYTCELARRVNVRGVPNDAGKVVVNWAGKDYTLDAVRTPSGALRYEDKASGLTWVIIPAKSMLLDTRKGRQLANECQLT